jgi:hypothetical protein
MAEEARSSITSYVPAVYELTCKSSQRVLWPRKVQLFSPRYYLTMHVAVQLLIFAVFEV